MQIDINRKYTTRDGRAVRLLCVDGPSVRPIVGVVADAVLCWHPGGVFFPNQANCLDLVESPREIQVKGFLNVYPDGDAVFYTDRQKANNFSTSQRFACVPIDLTVKEGFCL